MTCEDGICPFCFIHEEAQKKWLVPKLRVFIELAIEQDLVQICTGFVQKQVNFKISLSQLLGVPWQWGGVTFGDRTKTAVLLDSTGAGGLDQ